MSRGSGPLCIAIEGGCDHKAPPSLQREHMGEKEGVGVLRKCSGLSRKLPQCSHIGLMRPSIGKEDAMVKVDDAMRKHGECEEVEPSSTVVFAGKTKKMINVYQS